MKRLILLLSTLFLSGSIVGQGTQVFVVKGSGYEYPVVKLSPSPNGNIIEIDIESFTFEEVNTNGIIEDKILFPEGVNVSERGLPDMQHLAFSIAITPRGKTAIKVLESEYTDFPYFNIAPSTGDPGLIENSASIFITDSSVYSVDAFYPGTIAKGDNPFLLGSSRGQVLRFFPAQYNPVQKILRVYHHLKVELVTLPEEGDNEIKSYSIDNGSGTPLNRIIENHFVNNISTSRYVTVEEMGKMLIISHPNFINNLKPFIDWKIQKGIECEVVDVTTLGSTQKIKEFIAQYYYTKGLTYLLLVGDAEFVPTNQAKYGASDNMYGYIAGDDHYPEVLVGRFPCETKEQLDIMVNRTINYEKTPADNASFNRFLGIASSQGPGDDGEMDYEHLRGITSDLKTNGYSEIIELYDGSRGGSDQDGNPVASMTSSAVNKGAGALMYIGHGSLNGWTTSNFSSLDIRKLTNAITQPFIWSAGCNNGEFVGISCFAEEWLRAENNGKPAGAVATLMSSARQSWYPPMEAQDEIALFLANKKSSNHVNTFGGVSLSGCMKMNDKYGEGAYLVTDTWILFGDPSVELRTAIPTRFSPVHSSIIGIDTREFAIKGIDASAYVCISYNNKIIVSEKSSGNEFNCLLPGLSGISELTLTITGANKVPYISRITVLSTPSVAVNPLPGNNNRLVEIKSPIKWELTAGSKPEYYMLYSKKQYTSTWTTTVIFPGDSTFIQGLEYNTNYEWKVVSYNKFGSADSEIFKFTTIHRPDEDFENRSFTRSNWDNSEDWYVDNSVAYEGNHSLHSGNTKGRIASSLLYDCLTVSCDFISFWIKVNNDNNSAKVAFYMDNILMAEYNTTMPWTNQIFRVEPGKHTFEWRFINASDIVSNSSAVWIDNIYLPLNKPFEIDQTTQLACATSEISINPKVSGYASLAWKTSGTGYFNDETSPNPVYYPSDQDLVQGNIKLNLLVNSNKTCDAQNLQYALQLISLPELPVVDDVVLQPDEKVNLDPYLDFNNAYLLYPNEMEKSPLILDATKLSRGENKLTLVAENNIGCASSKELKVTVIEEQQIADATLIVYPNPAREEISFRDSSNEMPLQISIFSFDGRLIGSYIPDQINYNKIIVDHLEPGMYIVKSEHENRVITGKFIKI